MMTFGDRDRLETDALLTDRYLEALLIAADRRAADVPSDAGLDPAIRDAATRLGHDLTRIHPSFRFEERLAARLADLATALRMPAAAGSEGAAIPFAPQPDPDLFDARLFEDATSGSGLPRQLIIRGALTSAALSLAGAAYVAWRRNRAPLSPMARAVRAARQARLAARTTARTTARATSRRGFN